MREIPLREQRLGRFILLGFLLAISLPYAFAALVTPPGWTWGGLLFNVDDQNVHLSWARQVQDGAFFLRDLFTTEPLITGERPYFFNIFPLLLGWLARLTTLDVVWIYHIVRVAAAGIALWQFHLLALTVTRYEERYSRARILALCLIAFTTGAGFIGTLWPGYVQYFNLIDRPDGPIAMMPEAFFFLSALIFPINIISMALLAFIYRKVVEKQGTLPVFLAALALSNIHTYDALPLIVTVLLWLGWQFRQGEREGLKVGTALVVGAILPILYQVVVFRNSEEFRVKALTQTAAPPLLHLIISLLPLLLFLPWTRQALRELPGARLMGLWVAVTFVMIYLPVSFARKMIEGVHLPLCLLAALGAGVLLDRLATSRARQGVTGAVLLVLMLSPLACLGWMGTAFLENNASRWRYNVPPAYFNEGEAGALRALNAQKGEGAVLSSVFIGNYIPRATGKTVYLGHWAETLRFGSKLGQVLGFYGGQMSVDQARNFLKENRIRWVVESRFEQGSEQRSLPWQELGLQPVYTGGDAQTGTTSVYVMP